MLLQNFGSSSPAGGGFFALDVTNPGDEPATFVLRPFNFDTLAVQAYNLASDERLTEAATASLVIVAVGLLPILILSRAIRRTRRE